MQKYFKTMNRLKLLFVVCLIGVSGIFKAGAQTDSVHRFTLEQAQEFAINHFFVSQNAKLDIEIARKKIWETTALGLPQVSGTFNYQHVPNPPTMTFPDQNGNPAEIKLALENSATYGATVSQLVFSGEYIVGLQASRTYRTFAEENYEKVRIDLKETLAGTYYTVLILEQNREIVAQTVENLKLNRNHVERFFEQGLVESTDVDQLNLVLKRTENSLLTIERQIENIRKLLTIQLGLPAGSKVVLLESLEALLDRNLVAPTNYTFNLEEHIDYRLMQTNEDLMDLSMNREKSTFLPSVSAFYQYSDKTNKPDFDFNITHVLGVNVSIPIFSSGMRMAKVSQAKMELEKTRNQKEQQSQMLILGAQQALSEYNSAFENYTNEKQNFELSQKVFDQTTLKFKQGMVSALDLTTVNNQLLQAQLSYAAAVQDLLTKKVTLDKAYSKL